MYRGGDGGADADASGADADASRAEEPDEPQIHHPTQRPLRELVVWRARARGAADKKASNCRLLNLSYEDEEDEEEDDDEADGDEAKNDICAGSSVLSCAPS